MCRVLGAEGSIMRGFGLSGLGRPWTEEGRSLPLLPVRGRISCSTEMSALVIFAFFGPTYSLNTTCSFYLSIYNKVEGEEG